MASAERNGERGYGVGVTLFGILNICFYCESRLLCVKRELFITSVQTQ